MQELSILVESLIDPEYDQSEVIFERAPLYLQGPLMSPLYDSKA